MVTKNQININTILIIVALIIFVVFVIPKLSLRGFQFGSITDPISLFDNEPDPECTFKVDKSIVCLGENVTGTLNAKSPTCYIGYNYNHGNWKFAGMINETSPGFYKESRAAPAIGHYEFAAICGTPANFCRTNNVEVDVILCNGDDDNGEFYTCGWSWDTGQCGGTCPGTHPLCVDMWAEDNALFGDNSYLFCACIDPNTETVHPDWKPDGQYYEPVYESDEPNGEPTECIDTDPTQDVYLFGNCIPSSGGNNPDFCPTDFAVTQFACISSGDCNSMSMDCPVGTSCSDGVCVSYPNGEPLGTYTAEECYNLMVADDEHVIYDDFMVTDDGSIWDEIACYNEAYDDCGGMVANNRLFDNCCYWRCYVPPD